MLATVCDKSGEVVARTIPSKEYAYSLEALKPEVLTR